MNIGWAVDELRAGSHVRRAGWNGKGMFLYIVDYDHATTDEIGDGNNYEILPSVWMKTADDKVVPWLCSQTDLLAEDWELAS